MSNRNFTEILVCDSSFKLNGDISHDILSELSPGARIFIETGEISLPKFRKYNYETFISQLVTLRDTLKQNKINLNAKITALLYQDNGEYIGVNIKPKAKEIKIDEGNVKVIFSKSSTTPKKKPLTKDEKLELVRAWRTEHPRENIEEKTKYRDFALGKFCMKAAQDAEIKVQLDHILGE